MFQILAVLSLEAVSAEDPFGENIAEQTQTVCPDNVLVHSPEVMFQILAVPSSEALSAEDPSGENTAEQTFRVCPDNV